MFRFLFLLFSFILSTIKGQDFSGIDSFLKENIEKKLTPNINLVFGNNSANFYLKSFGKNTYEAEANAVDINSIYDLASLTKVFSTTLCIMKLYEENRISLDDKVSKYLPNFSKNDKEDVTIKNLLLHNSGLPAYYSPKNDESPSEIIDNIFSLKKAYKTGDKYLYSCLNFVTLMKIVEAVTDKRMYDYYSEIILEPLNLKDTYFIPPDSIHYKIIPTTPQLQGKVHDPLAYGLKGLSGNAGLFSTTSDLSIICKMLLNKGIYNGTTIFKKETVDLFTTQYDSTSSRALGWDTNGFLNSSAGTYFSKKTFGHTGYTGTSVWIDPVNNLFVVLLTNRVYPDDKVSLTEMRISLHNYIFMNLHKIPPQPILESLNLNENKITVTYDNQSKYVPVDNTFLIYSINNFESSPIDLPKNSNSYSFSFNGYDKDIPIKSKLFNVTQNNKSMFSDEFAILNKAPNVLIIDACILESNEEKEYNKLTAEYFNFLPENFGFSCISVNHAKLLTKADFNKFTNIIIYSAESSALSPFTDSSFVGRLLDFVNSGGNIIITGSEFGWYLGRPEAGKYLNNLYSQLFNCYYVNDDAHSSTLLPQSDLNLITNQLFFGTDKSIYKTRTPDVIKPFEHSKPLFWYDHKNIAGTITNVGMGKIIYLAFPLESIEDDVIKKDLFNNLFNRIFKN